MASRCPGGPPSCSQGYRSARDSSAITLDFAAHTCLDDIVTEVCARQDIQSWPHVCIFSPVRLGSKGCLNAADISGCCAAFIFILSHQGDVMSRPACCQAHEASSCRTVDRLWRFYPAFIFWTFYILIRQTQKWWVWWHFWVWCWFPITVCHHS